jgi:hypothetical protein
MSDSRAIAPQLTRAAEGSFSSHLVVSSPHANPPRPDLRVAFGASEVLRRLSVAAEGLAWKDCQAGGPAGHRQVFTTG